jgi:hypothetical protein
MIPKILAFCAFHISRFTSAFLIILLLPFALFAADPDQPPIEVSPPVDSAVAAGLNFLASQQKPDGAFDSSGPKVGITGLVLMSFLASGNVPDEGKYGTVVRAAMDYLVHVAPPDGYFGKLDGSRMYGQGIVTLALAEGYGADHDPQKRKESWEVLKRAVDVIFKAQDVQKSPSFSGGWRYEPTSADADLSLSGWSALALRAASNIGFEVPKDRVQRAVQFVLRCYHQPTSGFGYQPGKESSIAMTGVGMLNLYLLDGPNHPEIAVGAKYLVDHPLLDNTPKPYYAMYYSTQAAFQTGGATWQTVWHSNLARLLTMQQPDGGWPISWTPDEPGRIYSTTMAVLALSVPYRVLPIYQR